MKRILTTAAALLALQATGVAQPQTADGVALLQQRKYQEAVAYFRNLTSLYPRDARSWLYLSQAYLGADKLDSAEIAGRKSLQFDDENPDAYVAVSEALIRTRKLGPANIVLREGLAERKNHPGLLLQLGFLQLASDSADAALVTFTRAREVSPRSARAYEGLGDTYARQGVNPMAVSQYERSLELDSLQPDLLNKLAELHLSDRRYNEAVRAFQRVVDLDPSNLEARFKLGHIYYRAKLFTRASRVFEEFVKKNPKDTAALKMYVESLFNSRQFKDVPAFADRAYKLDPTFREALRMKAESQLAIKEYQHAIDSYRALAGVDSLTADDHTKVGRAYQELDKPVEAVASYEKAIAMDRSLALVMNDAGTLYMKLKQWEDAARMFEMRYTVDSTAVTAYINYAQCMLVLERYDKAANALVIAINRAPDYVPSYTRLGIAYLQMKDYPQARKAFENVITVIDTAVTKYQDDLAQAHRYIGLVLLLDKKWDDAVKSLRRSLDFAPKDEQTLLWLAQGLQNAQKKDEAIRYYKEVLKINKNNEQAKKGLEVLEGNSE